MKIAISTNIDASTSPMLNAYISYLSSSEYQFTISSDFKLINHLPHNGNHFYSKYSENKFYYLLLPFVSIYLIYFVFKSLLFDKEFPLKKVKSKIIIKDLWGCTKFYLNLLALNIIHFYNYLKYKPDLVICICAGSTLSARWYKFITGTNYIYSMYEIYPNQFNPNYIFTTYLKSTIESKGCKSCVQIIIPVSNVYKRLLKLRYQLDSNKKFVQIANIVENHKIQYSSSVSLPLKLYYHGGLDYQRGLDVLLDVIESFNCNQLHLYLRGGGADTSPLKNIVNNKQLNDRVSFLETISPDLLPKESSKYDVGLTMVHNYTSNNRFLIGFKAVDYIAAGICLLVPDGYVLRKMVLDYDIGTYYEKLSHDKLRSSISYLVNNIDKVQEFKINVINIAKEEFNYNSQKEVFLKSIKKVIK